MLDFNVIKCKGGLVTFYILRPPAFFICHIILFPVVLRSTDHAKQTELYFSIYALCLI